uniref:Uncharacterized protein n=1 Tax=Oryza sativa subsp. japonica TaxID=39947 RepID=Q6YYN6_ORYSJ|nr:hypothetical protein [Oryza sativa Japonica Group]
MRLGSGGGPAAGSGTARRRRLRRRPARIRRPHGRIRLPDGQAGRRGSGWRRRCLPPDLVILVDDRRWGLLPDGWLRCGGPDWDTGLHGGGGVVARRPCGGAAGVGRWRCRRIWGRARIQPHSTAITTGDDEGTPCGCLLISLELLPFLTAWSWGAPLRDGEDGGKVAPAVVWSCSFQRVAVGVALAAAARGALASARRKPAQFLGGNGDVFGRCNPLEGVVEVPPSPSSRIL